jgi:programmed cell death protein 5
MADDDLEAIRAARRQQLQSQAGPSGGGGGGGGGDEQQQKQDAQCVESFREAFHHKETVN